MFDVDELKQFLYENAYYGDGNIKYIDILPENIFSRMKFLGSGLFSNVYKLEGSGYVLKEGKWTVDMNLVSLRLKFPIKLLEMNSKFLFKYSFLPYPEEMIRQYDDYIKFAKYFGCFDNSYQHPRKKEILDEQLSTRTSLLDSIEELELYYQFKFRDNIKIIIENQFYNFLPEEFTLYAKSTTNPDQYTSFIFQEFVDGIQFPDIDLKELSSKTKCQLVLFMYLILFLRFKEDLIPDIRPNLSNFHNWIMKSPNLMLCPNGDVKFIDTRWFWNLNDNFVKRGLIIPEIGLIQLKYYINKLLDDLT